MEKERGGLWPPSLDGCRGDSFIFFSIFFLCSWIILLVDQTSFLAAILKYILASLDETLAEPDLYVPACIFISFCVAFVLFYTVTREEWIADHFVPFVCFPGLPFYLIWLNLGCIGLHWLFDLVVIAAAVLLPWKIAVVILVYMYGVFASLLWTDTHNTTPKSNLLRLLISCVLMAFVCFKHLLIA